MTPLYFLVGPTASGKKRVGRRIAQAMGAELLSLDSIKVYKGMDRGTGKSSEHRFLLTDLVEATQPFSVASYVTEARKLVGRLRAENRRALFVGGTGLYLRALVRGLFEAPPVPPQIREKVRERLREFGSHHLHVELEKVDAATSQRLHPRDAKRITRALEVFEATGRPISRWQAEETRPGLEGPYRLAGLRFSRGRLRQRIDSRVMTMLESGLIDEVRHLQESNGLGPVAAEAIGYREVLQHLNGELDREACQIAIQQHTWTFARHQLNWFRQFKEIEWIEADERSADQQAEEIIRRWGFG